MSVLSSRQIYFSFFMFTADLRPDDRVYTDTLIRHMHVLTKMGYDGFDLPISPTPIEEHQADIVRYTRLKQAFDQAGLSHVQFTTNVAATRLFDPSSPDAEQRADALIYLKSRVDITKVLGGTVMAGPIVCPYGVFPTTETHQPIWSNALQDWVLQRYQFAQPILEDLGTYAQKKGIKLAIEPVDHWETAPPNLVADVLSFLQLVSNPQVGICIDSAHVVLGSDGPEIFVGNVLHIAEQKRLHYVHVSAPDRGAVHDSWIPWGLFLNPILAGYEGPLLIEVFNAIPVFLNSLRLARRKFWIPDEDSPIPNQLSAYDIASKAIASLRQEIRKAAVK